MKKEDKLVESIVALADEPLGGERSKKAAWLFTDIAAVCRELGYARMGDIMERVADNYIYD